MLLSVMLIKKRNGDFGVIFLVISFECYADISFSRDLSLEDFDTFLAPENNPLSSLDRTSHCLTFVGHVTPRFKVTNNQYDLGFPFSTNNKSTGGEGVGIGRACDRIVARAPKPTLRSIPRDAGRLSHGCF